jgi:hypothetical protein
MEFFFSNSVTIPFSQVAILLIVTTVALLGKRLKLALLICYAFALYWGYLGNINQVTGFGTGSVNYSCAIGYLAFGFLIAILAAVGFFLNPD